MGHDNLTALDIVLFGAVILGLVFVAPVLVTLCRQRKGH